MSSFRTALTPNSACDADEAPRTSRARDASRRRAQETQIAAGINGRALPQLKTSTQIEAIVAGLP
jgi:hypothetical protein